MSGAIFALLNTHLWRGVQLKHRDNFTFIFVIYKPTNELHSYGDVEHQWRMFLRIRTIYIRKNVKRMFTNRYIIVQDDSKLL
jgi:hypothetical protein